MNRNDMLRKYATFAKSGDRSSFENFYILTSEDAFRKISALKVDQENDEAILTDVYVNLWKNVRYLRTNPEDIPEWIYHEIERCAVRRCGADVLADASPEGFAQLTEDQQANVWFRIENRIGVLEEEAGKPAPLSSYLLMIAHILLAIFILVLSAALIWFLLRIL